MASGAKRDQISFGIIPGSAPELNVVHLEVSGASAELATPSVPFQHLLMKFSVGP
jgi:hypothetical protein